jgi:hypothetical protein
MAVSSTQRYSQSPQSLRFKSIANDRPCLQNLGGLIIVGCCVRCIRIAVAFLKLRQHTSSFAAHLQHLSTGISERSVRATTRAALHQTVHCSTHTSPVSYCVSVHVYNRLQQAFRMGIRFVNQTSQTTLLPQISVRAGNATKAAKALKTAEAAQNRQTTAETSGPCTVTELEEFISNVVRTSPASGCARLLPHSDTQLFYKDM